MNAALRSPALPAALRAFLDSGLILDPWLAGLSEERFSFESQDGRAGVNLRLGELLRDAGLEAESPRPASRMRS